MNKLTIWIAYEKDYAEYRYILTKIDEIAENLKEKDLKNKTL